MAIFPYDAKTGRALCERVHDARFGYRGPPITTPAALSLRETLEWARRIPSSARIAQGFTRIADFARHVKQLRAQRAELHKPYIDPLRRTILDTLDRIVSDRNDLVVAARREAGFWWKPRVNVWWSGGKPRTYDNARLVEGYRYSPKRDVAVPATWLLARLGDDASNLAVRLRNADPRNRILSIPRWIDRVAAGVLSCPDNWLTPGERAEVAARAAGISSLRGKRAARKPLPELRVGEIHVTAARRGYKRYDLRLSGVAVHAWGHWPSRAEILAAVAQTRALAPALNAPDTLGWRGWLWDGTVLISPVRWTPWHDIALCAVEWSDGAAVRGQAGIHAIRLPPDWRRADPSRTEIGRCTVHGIVERFGRYVLGTEGWRAEWVVIRELMAPDTKTALALMRKYPEVRVHIKEQERANADR